MEPQLVTKLLLQVLVREIHNSMVITPEEGGLKEARDAENNIIISDSTLRNILPRKINNTTSQYKVMFSCECFISYKSMNSSLLTWHNCCLKHLKDRSQNAQNRRSGEIPSCTSATYKNAVRPHGCHIYNNAEDMAMETMCPCTYKHHKIPH